MKILNIVGARPNFMKIAPIHREMQKYPIIKSLLIHTGQHYDDKMSKLFFQDLELPEPDVYLGVGSGTHTAQTARIMLEFEKVMDQEKPDLVLVVGDVNSTAACSLVAAKMQTKIAHVEAGLRSFDRSMPEEINRIITDSLSDYLFVTEASGVRNLRNEGISESKIFFTGNVMIDSLIHLMQKADRSTILSDLNIDGHPYALITLHRPSNVDSEENLSRLFSLFFELSDQLRVVFPAHPRTKKMLDKFGLSEKIKQNNNFSILDPIGYIDFMRMLKNATLVLTDSGGIQEETTYLGVPCLTIRENTERPVTIEVGTNVLTGTDPENILTEARKILSGHSRIGKIPDLWDGHAAERIVQIINNGGTPS